MENVKPWQVLNCKESRDQLKKVNPDKVWPHLFGCKVVEKEDVRELAQKQSRESQMDKLLKLISQKGLKTYNKFVEYLEKNDHGRIANYLLKEEKELAYSELEKKAKEIKEVKTQLSVEKENAANVKKELEEEKAVAYSELEKKEKQIEEVKTQFLAEKENTANVKKELEKGQERLKEATRIRETLKDENDRLRTKLDEKIRQHESTRQELEEIGNLSKELKKTIREQKDTTDTAQFLKDTAGENDHQKKVVSSKHIQAIVDHVEPLTMDLGAHLEVPTPEFLNIEEENDLNRKKIWKVLIKWKHRKGKGATLGILIDVLHKLKQTEAVDKLLGMEGVKKEARAQSVTLKKERDQLITNLEEERQQHEITQQELKKCEQKLAQLLGASTGNGEFRSTKKKEEKTMANAKEKMTVSGSEEFRITKRKQEQIQTKALQTNMVLGNEEFRSSKIKEKKTVTNVKQKITASGYVLRTAERRKEQSQAIVSQANMAPGTGGKLKLQKPTRPIEFDHRIRYVKPKEMLFTYSDGKDAPRIRKGNTGKKR